MTKPQKGSANAADGQQRAVWAEWPGGQVYACGWCTWKPGGRARSGSRASGDVKWGHHGGLEQGEGPGAGC